MFPSLDVLHHSLFDSLLIREQGFIVCCGRQGPQDCFD